MSIRDIAVAAIRLLTGVALLVGIPAALILAVGWPLPREIPSLEAMLDTVDRHGVPTDVATNALAVIVWVAWTQLAIGTVIETAAAIGGRHARRARLLPGFQLIARQFVASCALVVTLLGPLRPTAATAADAPALDLVTMPELPPGQPTTKQASATPATAAGDDTHVVQRGESWWGLAEQIFGDGRRWHDVLAPNVGRTMPDGHTIAANDSFLRAGWEVILPTPPATTTGTAPTYAGGAPLHEEHVVEPDDNLWVIAERLLADQLGRQPTEAETAPYWLELVEANRNRITSGSPDLIYPGETLTVPAADPPPLVEASEDEPLGEEEPSTEIEQAPEVEQPATADTVDPATEAGVGDGGERHDTDGTEPTQPAPQDEEDAVAPAPVPRPAPPSGPSPTASLPKSATEPDPDASAAERDGAGGRGMPVPLLLGAASTVVAGALLRVVRRQRARRTARLPLHAMPPPPQRDTQPVQRELLNQGDEDIIHRLDAALVHLAEGLRPRGGQPCPQPKLVQLSSQGHVEVLLDRPHSSPPNGWQPDASGLIWVLDKAARLPSTDAPSPLPALVTIGAGQSAILVDLEAHGVVALTGDPSTSVGMARSIVTELSARAEGTVGIEIVDIDELAGLAEFDGVRVVPGWDHIDPSIAETAARALDAGRWAHAFAARASGRFDGWTPSVFVTAHSDHPAYRELLDTVARRPGRGTAVVVVGTDPGCGLAMELGSDGTFTIPEWALTATAQTLGEHVTDQLVALLGDDNETHNARDGHCLTDPPHVDTRDTGTAARTDGTDNRTAPDGRGRALGERLAGVQRGAYQDPAWDVVVRICGQVSVEGGKHPLPPVETAVAAHVALNGAVDVNDLRDAVWGTMDITRKRVRNVISTVGQALGKALIYSDGMLRPGDGLTTDVELIRHRLEYARHQPEPSDRVATLRGALEWVTGRACTCPSRSRRYWAWIELDQPSWIAHVDSVVGTAACELAQLHLQMGESHGAIWAATQGLTATGPREELTLLLVKGYELAGDEAAARDTLRGYERYMDDLGIGEHSDEMLAALERHNPRMRFGRTAN